MYTLYQDIDLTYTLHNSDNDTRTNWCSQIHETLAYDIHWHDYPTFGSSWKVVCTFDVKPTIHTYPELFL